MVSVGEPEYRELRIAWITRSPRSTGDAPLIAPQTPLPKQRVLVLMPADHPWMPWLQRTHRAAAFEHESGCACPEGVVTV